MTPLLPQLDSYCVTIGTGPGELCIEFPGGGRLCASVNYELGDPSAIVQALLAEVNTALMPLAPFFDVLDVIKAIVDCVQAIPDCLGPPPDPKKLADCLPGLVAKLNKLLQLLPPVSIPKMVKAIIGVVIQGLLGLRQKILTILNRIARITQAGIKAAKLGNVHLQASLDCASGNLDVHLQNMNAGLQPLNRLLGLINVFLKMAGLDCIPSIEGVAAFDKAALKPLDATIELLQKLQAAIPALDLLLPPVPPPTDPCA